MHNILTVRDDADHTRYRRLLNHAFSEKALQEQSPLIKKYVDLLISRLHEHAGDGPQDMVKWFNFVAFDIIGDLALGESFGCLETSELHPWVSFLFSSFKTASLLTAARKFPPFQSILLKLVPKRLVEERIRHSKHTREKVLKRMQMGQERGDFMSNVLRHNDKEVSILGPRVRRSELMSWIDWHDRRRNNPDFRHSPTSWQRDNSHTPRSRHILLVEKPGNFGEAENRNQNYFQI